jgi:hypothetical protein
MDISFLRYSAPAFMKLSLLINTPVLTIILALFAAGYLVVSGVLIYHWSAYGMGNPSIRIGRLLFLSVSLMLFIVAWAAVRNF